MMINVNELLKEYFQSVLETINYDDVDFSFVIPMKKFSDSIVRDTVNIYLLDVKENTQLRGNNYKRDYLSNGDIKESPLPIMLDMYFIISTYSKTNDVAQEHDLFATLLSSLYEFSFSYKDRLSNVTQVDATKISLEIFPQQYINEHLGLQLWNAIDQNVRPLISLKVTAPLEIEHTISTKKVTSKIIDYITLEKTLYTLRGRVVTGVGNSKENTMPIQANIKLTKQGGEAIKSVMCDTYGKFHIDHLQAQNSTMDVIADGYKTKHVSLKNIAELSSTELIIVLETI